MNSKTYQDGADALIRASHLVQRRRFLTGERRAEIILAIDDAMQALNDLARRAEDSQPRSAGQ